MRVGVEAGRLGHGGTAILDALVQALLVRPEVESVTVFGHVRLLDPKLHVIPMGSPHAGRLDTLRWAIRGWGAVAQEFDRAMSFSGFALAPNQTVLVHNALYYDAIVDTLPIGLQVRLQVLRRLTHDAVLGAKNVVVQSEVMRGHVWQAHGVDAHKIVTVPNMPSAGRQPNIDLLWVGNEVPFKDFRTAIAAAERLGRHLTLIGNQVAMPDGPFHTWLGDLDRAQVFEHYRSAKALLMTSRAESLGLPLIEAMQVGLPVVAPALPYVRELCGCAVEYYKAGNAQALATAIGRLENRRESLRLLGHQNATRLEAVRPFESLADLVLG